MTWFVLAQLVARWPQAVLLALLSAAATTAAVSAPVYAGAADRQVISAELAAAGQGDLFIAYGPHRREWSVAPVADPAVALLADLDGFVAVVSVQVPVSVDGAEQGRWLVARQDLCAHVVVHAGRCPVANREVALSPVDAAARGLRPGDQMVLTPLVDPAVQEAAGPPAGFTVSGLVEASDPQHPYWEMHHDRVGTAIYTTPMTVARLEHREHLLTVAAVLDGQALTPRAVPAVRAELDRVWREATRQSGGGVPPLHGSVPVLLDRMSGSSDEARHLLPVAAVPLLGLCWFVIYLAASHVAGGRRPELGAVAVRGPPVRVRLVLASGELLVPVVLGAPLGFALAHVVVAVATGGWVPVAPDQWVAAAAAMAGAVAAALFAVRRELAAPAAALLRWVPARRRWLFTAGEVVVVALAVVAVLQLHVGGGDLAGVAVLAPALVILAVVVLAVRLVWPAAGLAGRRALRRGRLDRAVAALMLVRRPAAARLPVVVAVVLGMLGFGVVAADVAAQQRAGHAEQVTGAARVVEIGPVDRVALLQAVRRADPDGRYAMAAVVVAGTSGQPARLAVDATRLAQVAGWRDEYGAADPGRVADLLRPPAPDSLVVHDGPIAVDLSVPDRAVPGTTFLSMTLVAAGGERQALRFGPLDGSRSTYRATVGGCAAGCRLAYLSVSVNSAGPAGVVWHGVSQNGQELTPAGWRSGHWRPAADHESDQMRIDSRADGAVMVVGAARPGVFHRALPPDVPYPLPVVIASDLPDGPIANIDNQPVAVVPVARLAGLPRLGGSGVLVDLEYAERSAGGAGVVSAREVWLAPDAPDDMRERLQAEGLVVTGERTAAGLQQLLDGSGPAVALRYHLLAAGMAVALVLVALVQVALADRRAWCASMRRLRIQGLPRRAVTATLLWSYGGLVAIGAGAGGVAAVAGWLATGDRLPLGARSLAVVWPRWGAVLVIWLAAVAALAAAGAVAGWWQQRAVAHGGPLADEAVR
jgi:putative ABC transport system permease protein